MKLSGQFGAPRLSRAGDEAVVGSAMTQNCISARRVEEIRSPKLTFKLRGISLRGSVVRVSPVRRAVLIGGKRETIALREKIAVRATARESAVAAVALAILVGPAAAQHSDAHSDGNAARTI